MPKGPERRRATRVRTRIRARLTGADGVVTALELRDVSVVGLQARASRALPVGTRGRIELESEGAGVEARATVVRSRGRALALRFDELPYEGYERLRAFLLGHADDPGVIAEELSERLGHLGDAA